MDNTIITVESAKVDSYGNLMVTPKGGGNDIRIGVKRKQLFSFFSDGAAVELIWDSFKNKDYVADVRLVGESLPAPKQPIQTGAMKKEPTNTSEMTKGDWSEKDRITRQSIQRQTSLKASVEWCIAKHATESVKTAMVLTVASLFESYLENGIQVEKK